ncbi:hypothetical protein ASF39_16460 [Methylobacterium sp. Leaf108]|nr:hypothetical protein ASF39_16460 [Methylobacterium sp. Leaf108]
MSVSISRGLPHVLFATSGRFLADSLAMQLDERELSRLRAALHSVAYCCDAILANPRTMPLSGVLVNGAIADMVVEGDAIIIFADANPKRGYATAHVPIGEILAARADIGCTVFRPAQANALARQISRDITSRGTTSRRPCAELRHDDLVRLAAHFLGEETVAGLREVTDGVPVLAIIGDTRPVGITSGQFFKSVTRLPGDWLGTSVPAGRC